ncbi:F-box protein At5g03100-like [Rhodamnia argentea]|uniref:F-box protein At5g03100-like n=1 Tax=Rhodamnia argentea TaxID=178133 RepID=A0A8B8N457_9MYRT|nr:F-box protein At5g03100-like [Rhodamnia argentea]
MAETSVHGAIHCKSPGDRPNRTRRIPPPPPLNRRDDISALPDDVIHHIFSFLTLRDVVKTSILSKRWQSTWTSTTDLVFNDGIGDDLPHSSRDFSSFVDSVLLQSTSPTVKRFHIMCDGVNSPKFDSWFCFAAARRVEDLRLLPAATPLFSYALPQFVCHLSWLVRLEFRKCRFSLGTTVRWPRLKVLSMSFAELSDHILEEIVRGSPVLESLELHMCKGVKNIRIDSMSVKKLILVYPMTCKVETIWARYLLSLWISGFLPNDPMFRLDNVSSLVEANLYFLMSRGERMLDLLKGLLEKLRGVPTIATCGRCFQFGLDDESRGRFNFNGEDYLCPRKGSFECLAKHLKRVEIIGYEANRLGSNHLLSLIKFLLGNAHALEKLIIKARLTRHVQKHLQAADLLKLYGMNKNVLSCRRASQNAEVIFVYRFNRVSC